MNLENYSTFHNINLVDHHHIIPEITKASHHEVPPPVSYLADFNYIKWKLTHTPEFLISDKSGQA